LRLQDFLFQLFRNISLFQETLFGMAADARVPAGKVCPMSIDSRPEIPLALPRAGVQRDNDPLMRWFSSAVTALTAALSILVVAVAAVVLGIT
jgi:hypothetical protein